MDVCCNCWLAGWLAGWPAADDRRQPPNLPQPPSSPLLPRDRRRVTSACASAGAVPPPPRPANGNLCRKGQQRVVLDPSPWPQGCRGCCGSGGARAQQDRGRLEWARLEQGGPDQIRAEGGGSLDQSCGPAVL